MTPEQRYLFDLNGYLHLEQALSPQELSEAQDAAERYINSAPEDLPPEFGTQNQRFYEHGFAFDKALERLVFHPSYWPVVKEFTDDKPRFMRGTLLVNQPGGPVEAGSLHCARESYGWQSTRYECRDGRIYCDDFVVFPYLYDVNPGDGGLVVLPGSHKANFDRPESLFNGGRLDEGIPPGVVSLTPKAGDVIIISELLTHGGLAWTPTDRKRVALVLRYAPQYRGGPDWVPESIKKRLSPETLELMAPGSYTDIKEVVKQDRVMIS